MAVKLESPFPFAERFLFYGGAGSGKTEAVLSIASHMKHGMFHVLDTDISPPYERAMYTTHKGAIGRLECHIAPRRWDPWCKMLADTIAEMNPENDWLGLDSVTVSYDACQNKCFEMLYGADMAERMIALRRENPESKEYAAALNDERFWPWVKREYYEKVWEPLRLWTGHFVMTAEPTTPGARDTDAEKMLYGHIGLKPAAQRQALHAPHTVLYLDHPNIDTWTMTTLKDRNRRNLDREEFDNFALDYLMNVAGWRRAA